MNYYISMWLYLDKLASSKAPMDVYKICDSLGFKRLELYRCPYKLRQLFEPAWDSDVIPLQWQTNGIKLKKGDRVLYQYPMYFGRAAAEKYIKILNRRGVHTAVLIHDLESIRYSEILNVKDGSSDFNELQFINSFEKIICHNEKMAEFLTDSGISSEKIVSLRLFDYLVDGCSGECSQKEGNRTKVAIAGNLSKDKCGYVYEFVENNPNLEINLYGVNYTKTSGSDNVDFWGSFDSSQLPKAIDADYGIVWDGPSAKTCTGVTGNYLKFNNPHKASCYISAGIPVVCWSESAVKDIILEYGAGIVVDSLENLQDILAGISETEYQSLREGALRLRDQVTSGSFTKAALAEAGFNFV